jgi:hypothetical protein
VKLAQIAIIGVVAVTALVGGFTIFSGRSLITPSVPPVPLEDPKCPSVLVELQPGETKSFSRNPRCLNLRYSRLKDDAPLLAVFEGDEQTDEFVWVAGTRYSYDGQTSRITLTNQGDEPTNVMFWYGSNRPAPQVPSAIHLGNVVDGTIYDITSEHWIVVTRPDNSCIFSHYTHPDAREVGDDFYVRSDRKKGSTIRLYVVFDEDTWNGRECIANN